MQNYLVGKELKPVMSSTKLFNMLHKRKPDVPDQRFPFSVNGVGRGVFVRELLACYTIVH